MVVVGESTTAKIARSRPRVAIQNAVHSLSRGGLKQLTKELRYGEEQVASIQHHLRLGQAPNLREARLAKLYPDLVVPTRTLLGGMVALQPTVTTTDRVGIEDPFPYFEKVFPGNGARIGHTLETPKNFGVHDGKVKFVDAGEFGIEEKMHDPEWRTGIQTP